MPEEVEVPLEEVHEHIAEIHEKHGKEGWIKYIAVLTAILAVIAAIGALESGSLVNEALLEKNNEIGNLTKASDSWNYYQAEGLKSLIYHTAAQSSTNKSAADDENQAKHYKEKQTDLMNEAKKLTDEAKDDNIKSEKLIHLHHIFAISVSLCQIAIALSAVAALTRKQYIWIIGLLSGAAGAVLLIIGFVFPKIAH